MHIEFLKNGAPACVGAGLEYRYQPPIRKTGMNGIARNLHGSGMMGEVINQKYPGLSPRISCRRLTPLKDPSASKALCGSMPTLAAAATAATAFKTL